MEFIFPAIEDSILDIISGSGFTRGKAEMEHYLSIMSGNLLSIYPGKKASLKIS